MIQTKVGPLARQARETVAVGMLLGVPELDIVAVGSKEQTPSLYPRRRRYRDTSLWFQDDLEWLVISLQGEMITKQVLMKLPHSPDEAKSLPLDLGIFLLCC